MKKYLTKKYQLVGFLGTGAHLETLPAACKTTGVVVVGGLDPGPTGGTFIAASDFTVRKFMVENQKNWIQQSTFGNPRWKLGGGF